MEHQLGCSAYVLSNRKNQKEIVRKYSTVGHSAIRVTSQFDVALETSISCLPAGMSVIGFNASKTFLEAKCDRPFAQTFAVGLASRWCTWWLANCSIPRGLVKGGRW